MPERFVGGHVEASSIATRAPSWSRADRHEFRQNRRSNDARKKPA
jgi:hypothetical protein